MKKMPLEKDFQRGYLKKLRAIPKSWFKKINDSATAGIPDIIGCIGIYFISIELKTRSKLSELQLYTLEKINSTGAVSLVVTPDNADEVLLFLSQLSSLETNLPLRRPMRIPASALR
jgi:outer membrane phospholipase A